MNATQSKSARNKPSPRINVTVTQEQHALLLELASLKGGSAASFLRGFLDETTPLLREAVSLLRDAAQEKELSLQRAEQILSMSVHEMRTAAIDTQIDLEEVLASAADAGAKQSSGASRDRCAPAKRASQSNPK